MNNTDLLIFDQTGNLMNYLSDGNKDTYRKIIEPSELGTYNSTSLHIFEKIEPAVFDFAAKTDVIQYINDNNIIFNEGNTTCIVNSIETTNTSSLFKTKWLYGYNIDKIAPIGSNIVFEGFPSPFTETSGGKTNYYVVLKTKTNAILIEGGNTNDVALPSITFNNTTYIRTLSCVKINTVSSYSILPSSNEYLNRTFNIINTKNNDGEYNITELVNNKTIKRSMIDLTSSFNTLKINFTYLTNRILLYDGILTINTNRSIVFQDSMPGNIKIGDEFYLEGTSLNVTNQQFMVVTSIDTLNKTVFFSSTSTPVSQTLSLSLGLTKNTISYTFAPKKDFTNTSYSSSVTAAFIATKLSNLLDKTINCYASGNYIVFETKYEGSYFTVEGIKDGISSVTVTSTNPTIYLYCFDNIKKEETNKLIIKPSESIMLTKPDQLILEINGFRFIGADDTTADNVALNFYNTNASVLLNRYNITLVRSNNILTFNINDMIPNEAPNIKIISSGCTYFRTAITVNEINTNLNIIINGNSYNVLFDTDVDTTISNWYNIFKNTLEQNDIFIKISSNVLYFYTISRFGNFTTSVNIGSTQRIGENLYSIVNIDNYTEPVLLISYNLLSNNINPLLKNICVGQTISLSGINNIYNKKYVINNITSTRIGLSYQGSYAQLGSFTDLTIATDMHLRYPLTDDPNENLIITIDNGFFIDTIGEQAIKQQSIPYTGPTPISDYVDKFILIPENNTSIIDANNPSKQRNVYDKLLLTLPTILNDITTPSSPINLHIGILPETEEYINTEINIYKNRNIELTISTALNNDNLVLFQNNIITIANSGIDLSDLKIGDTYIISYKNLTGLNNIILDNNNTVFKITGINGYTITTDVTFITESSLKIIPKTSYPYVDSSNNQLYENKALQIIFTYVPQVIKKINLLSEVNFEDDRFKVRLKNIGRNVEIKDLSILKNYNNDEYNIKWSVLNQKRKEMIEVHPDIFDRTSTYFAMETALQFWGYRDLKLFEYFINNNIDSPNFGSLKAVEKNGFSSEYVWPNDGNLTNYIKTNKISLGYRITDLDGNYIESVNLRTLQSKLFKLKHWLSDNVLSTADLTDISGLSSGISKLYLAKQSGISTGLTSNVSSAVLEYKVTGFNNGILSMPTAYNIIVKPIYNPKIKEYTITYNTFKVDTWDINLIYLQDKIVKYNNKFWKCNYNTKGETPQDNSSAWSTIKIPSFDYVTTKTIIANNFDDIIFEMDSTIENMVMIKSTAFIDGKISIMSKIIELGSGIWLI